MSCPQEMASSGAGSAAEPPRWTHDSLIGITESAGSSDSAVPPRMS